jgi:ABC-2 type transport system ATP-binding protein
MEAVIQAVGLRKAYGSTVAMSDVSFEVAQGEIFALVGPNGAGKTTTIECLEGFRCPDAGSVRVLGHDPTADGSKLRERIGIQLQEANLPTRIKVWEAADLFASFYARPVDWRRLLDELGLAEMSEAPFGKLSGGQKQRLFIALALVNAPELLFLDELTTGLDPQGRRKMWELIQRKRAEGKTVFLTTHFMEEAERLADRVAIMDRGKILALDSPANLVRGMGTQTRVVFEVEGDFDPAALTVLESVSRVERIGNRVIVHGGERVTGAVVGVLERRGCRFQALRSEAPTLEDVFLSLTGRELRD